MAKTSTSRRSGSVERTVTDLTFRKQLAQILKRVRNGKERFVVKKRGEAQGVFLGVEEYFQLSTGAVPEFDALRRDAQSKGLDRLTLRDINREIKQYRQERRKKLTKI